MRGADREMCLCLGAQHCLLPRTASAAAATMTRSQDWSDLDYLPDCCVQSSRRSLRHACQGWSPGRKFCTWCLHSGHSPLNAGCRTHDDSNSLLRTHVLEWVNIGVGAFCLLAMLLTCAWFGRRVWAAACNVRQGGARPLSSRKRCTLGLTCAELLLHTLNLGCYLAMNIYAIEVGTPGRGGWGWVFLV